MEPTSKIKKAKELFRRKERLESLIRVLKKCKQAGVQNQELNEKIANFTKECFYISLRLNNQGSQEVAQANEDKNKRLPRNKHKCAKKDPSEEGQHCKKHQLKRQKTTPWRFTEDQTPISRMDFEKSYIQNSKNLKWKISKPKTYWRHRYQMDLKRQFNNWWFKGTIKKKVLKMETPNPSMSDNQDTICLICNQNFEKFKLCNVHIKTLHFLRKPIGNLHYHIIGHSKQKKKPIQILERWQYTKEKNCLIADQPQANKRTPKSEKTFQILEDEESHSMDPSLDANKTKKTSEQKMDKQNGQP